MDQKKQFLRMIYYKNFENLGKKDKMSLLSSYIKILFNTNKKVLIRKFIRVFFQSSNKCLKNTKNLLKIKKVGNPIQESISNFFLNFHLI